MTMNDDDQELEQRLARAMPHGAPAGLRDATLAQVQRELRAGRWDRRLGRLAAAILVAGVALNVGLVLQGPARPANGAQARMAGNSRSALAETEIIVADVTDAETARRFVRQMAALGAWELSNE
jgi:hypothetical protein